MVGRHYNDLATNLKVRDTSRNEVNDHRVNGPVVFIEKAAVQKTMDEATIVKERAATAVLPEKTDYYVLFGDLIATNNKRVVAEKPNAVFIKHGTKRRECNRRTTRTDQKNL